MRLDESLIHASLTKAIEDHTSAISAGVYAAHTAHTTHPQAASYHRYNKAWFKEYGRGLTLGAALWLSTFFSGVAVAENGFKQLGVPMVLAAIGGGILHGMLAYRKSKRETSVSILESLIPVLADQTLKAYAQTIVAVFQTEGIAKEDRIEILKQMYSVMEDRERIAQQRDRLTQMAGNTEARAELEKEIAALEAKVQNTADPSANEVFAASLEIAKGRLVRWESYAPLVDRLDAQAAMVEQTLRGYAESVARMGAVPGHASHEMDALRSRLASVQGYAQAVEEAIEEVRTI